jgi:hypothetical protein
MKKTNNKFRNNNGNSNNIYSLNYKFDSVSIAGKFNATALDLIKRYNELAKEAQSRGDYVDMEVFRQYAEHYRKIVTEINERKNQNRENNSATQTAQPQETEENAQNSENQAETVNNGLVETEAAPREEVAADSDIQSKPKKRAPKRTFTVVEVSETENKTEDGANENTKTAKPVRKRRLTVKSSNEEGEKAQGE